MSISWGTQYAKLKTNLRLATNRLKLMEKKKTEMAMKARTEIADFISAHKPDRARIRVEHIIREDFLVEAFELLEMYCDLILARFGLLEQMKTLDDGIAEAVISILWAAPRIATDITEFKIISDQLTMKYGKPLAEAARANQLEYPARVAPKLIAKLSVSAPPKLLVERYMIEIAASAGIPFTPDPDVMREDEVAQAEKMLIDFKMQQNMMQGGPGVPPPPGHPPGAFPPGPGGFPPAGGFPPGGGSGGMDASYGWNLPPPSGAPPVPPFHPPTAPSDIGGGSGGIYEVPKSRDSPPTYDDVANQTEFNGPPPGGMVRLPKIGGDGKPVYPAGYPVLSARNSVVEEKKLPPAPSAAPPSAPMESIKNNDLDDLQFPDVPSSFTRPPGGSPPGSGGDLDLDDLARRFDQLKKK